MLFFNTRVIFDIFRTDPCITLIYFNCFIHRITNSSYSGVKIAEVSATRSNGYASVKSYSYPVGTDNILPLPSVPRATVSMSDLNRLTDPNMSDETKSLNTSQISEEKKKNRTSGKYIIR